jgi:hypothetical protein
MSENNTESKPSKILALIPLFIALGIIVGVFIGEKISEKGSYNSGTFSTDDSNPSKLVNIIEYIEKNYVDSVSKTQLIDNALESILHILLQKKPELVASNSKVLSRESA